MPAVALDRISKLQKDTGAIRNICILAHVDHGKTTLADTLVASNGIISQRLAGKLRYLDSREDEQLRGITMKSSAISLFYSNNERDYLINLLDSPGHIDFSSEVSTAVRLCDGAIVLVDVVEGVCPQTHAVLRQAWLENIKPVLVLNKIDRLIIELKMSPLEAHMHLSQILQQVNAITGELFTSDAYEKSNKKADEELQQKSPSKGKEQVFKFESVVDDEDEDKLYFSPDEGNVIFASAIDGWGFGINNFAEQYSSKLGLNSDVLKKTLWGDFYLESKTKRIKRGAQNKGKKPLFVQFILDNIWAVYDAIYTRQDKEMTEKIVKSLNLKINPRELSHNNVKQRVQAVLSQWLPLSTATLDMVVRKLPSPLEMVAERAEKLLCPHSRRFDSLPMETQQLKQSFVKCSGDASEPTVVFVSKLFPVERRNLPKNKARPLSLEDMTKGRESARQRHADRMAAKAKQDSGEVIATEEIIPCTELIVNKPDSNESPGDQLFIAFARVFSGTVKKGQKLLVLGPKYDPAKTLDDEQREDNAKYCSEFTVEDLYLFMGRELEALDSIPAGNILGIGGLEHLILKSATVSSTPACPAFTDMYFEASPIVRVAVQPTRAGDMKALEQGLKLLNQSDPSVEIMIQQNGEHVIIAAGEVHLQKCLDDLRQRYAKIEVNVSPPIVPFRETVIIPPTTDMVNEDIEDQTKSQTHYKIQYKDDDENDESDADDEHVLEGGAVELQTANRLCSVCIRAVPLPQAVTQLLEQNQQLLHALDNYSSAILSGNTNNSRLSQNAKDDLLKLKQRMQEEFKDSEQRDECFVNAVDKMWSFGPRRCGPNILLNNTQTYNRPSVWDSLDTETIDKHRQNVKELDSCVINGFQMASLSGPICEDPLHGVCFVVERWERYEIPMALKERRQIVRTENENVKRIDIDSSFDESNLKTLKKFDFKTDSQLSRNLEASLVIDIDQSKALSVTANQSQGSGHMIRSQTTSCDPDKTNVDLNMSMSQDECSLDIGSPVSPDIGSPGFMPQSREVYGPMSGQMMYCVKACCRKAFQAQPQRLMWAMYTCVIQAGGEILGKMYGVLSKRHGRILDEDLKEGTSLFNIEAVLPVAESFGFSEEIRKKTSGLASPQLKFSHWEVIDVDPYWVPTTEEEYLHFGEKADSENVARKYMNSVRRRKGLLVDEKLVESGTKQRTLTKMK